MDEPGGHFLVLFIICGNVVQKALAQVSGSTLTPVAFKFGSTLMAVVGDGRLMPAPDHPVKMINAKNGYRRENRSWILGRLFRNFENDSPLDDDIGLHIAVFKSAEALEHGIPMSRNETEQGKPTKDWVWPSGLVVMIVLLIIAAIPWMLHRDWGIISATVCGIALALVTGSLPQWRLEKWACRTTTTKDLILTGGNGTRHVMVIIGAYSRELDLEDLAAAGSLNMKPRQHPSSAASQAKSEGDKMEVDMKSSDQSKLGTEPAEKVRVILGVPVALRGTQAACFSLAALWMVLLITGTELKENTWFLLANGGLCMLQNVVDAGASRESGTTGIILQEMKPAFEQKNAPGDGY